MNFLNIVISTYQEPIKSWVDNINGPVLAFAAIGLGIAHVGYNLKNTFDMVPADMCTNGLLATTWDSVENRQRNSKSFTNKIIIFQLNFFFYIEKNVETC